MAKPAKPASIVQGEEGDEPESKEIDTRPLYRLMAQSYIDDRLLEVGTKIRSNDQPGWHWKPLDEAAKKQVEKYLPDGQREIDPILVMTKIDGGNTTEEQMIAAVAQMARSVDKLATQKPAA